MKLLSIAYVFVGVFLCLPLAVMAGHFCKADRDGNCTVDLADLVTMKSKFLYPDCEACSPPYFVTLEKTGQTTSYAKGDDGDLEKGVSWPNPRFTDNLDGTVKDNLIGLIWLKNANCFGKRTWNNALLDSNGLESGECGLTDSSNVGDWRLPNLRELHSLIDFDKITPALPYGHPFTNVQSHSYWSSTTYANSTNSAWRMDMASGIAITYSKISSFYVWPVRGGQ